MSRRSCGAPLEVQPAEESEGQQLSHSRALGDSPSLFQSSHCSFMARVGIMTDSDTRGQIPVAAQRPGLMGANGAILLSISTSAWAAGLGTTCSKSSFPSLPSPSIWITLYSPKSFSRPGTAAQGRTPHSWRDLKSPGMGIWGVATLGNGWAMVLGGLSPYK